MKPEIESTSQKNLKLRFAIFLLILAGLFGGYQLWRKYSEDPTNLLPADTEGMIAAVELLPKGSRAVIFKSDGAKLESPDHKSGATDRDLAWQPDGNRLYFASDREDNSYHIFRWNPSNQMVERRTTGSRSKLRPKFDATASAADLNKALIAEGGTVLEMDPSKIVRTQLLPPNQQVAGDEQGSISPMEGFYKQLGSSFREARWGKNREFIVAVMRRDEGEVLIVQGMIPVKIDATSNRLPQPIGVIAGKKIDFDISVDGKVVFSVLGIQNVADQVLDRPDAEVQKIPFKNSIEMINPGDPKSGRIPLFLSDKIDQAFSKVRFTPDGNSVVGIAGVGSELGDIKPVALVLMPAAEGGAQKATPLVRGSVTDFDIDRKGESVVYTERRDGATPIFVAPISGGDSKPISGATGNYSEPRFSPQNRAGG